ncbi:NfeD family protein [Acetivibrio straminisolvens]|uniref:NfeD-like C-terminal domain-containing protein n=2 Tax=Acetivibrio straminisolvens TaxID=253314 RepID=W4V9Z9_9FIRM|nr:NfeD family protein [Acetivibrio straminisolvens]GAE90250.1 hypothetical protein JCM21531_3842 [Acetivibrio straminisolvens JCM 21531]
MDVLILLAIILVVLGIALAIILRSASRGRLAKLVLTDSLEKEKGFEGTEDFTSFLDKEGVALTALRPAGTAEFNGVKLDVVSEFDLIEKDSRVKIIKVEGRRIVVRKIE